MESSDAPHAPSHAGLLRYVFALLLISAVGLAAISTLSCGGGGGGCGPGSYSTSSDVIFKNSTALAPQATQVVTATIQTLNPQAAYRPGEVISLTLQGSWLPEGIGEIRWYPPLEAERITFGDRQPLLGGPPYIFEDVSQAEAAVGIPVAYTVPMPPLDAQGAPAAALVDYVAVYGPDLVEAQFALSSHPYRATAQPASQTDLAAAAEPAVWSISHYNDFVGHLDQSGCQEIVTQSQSAQSFTAWRVPLAAALLPNQSYVLPLLYSDYTRPRLELAAGSVPIQMPMEVRFPATQWANLNLPSAPGEIWLAVGADPGYAVTCPTIDSETYSLVAHINLDLSAQPAGCQNCALPVYAVYDTQNSTQAQALGVSLNLGNFGLPHLLVGENTLAIGPAEVVLVPTYNSDWAFHAFTEFVNLQRGSPIAIQYWLDNLSPNPLTLTLAPSSTLPGVTWVIYPGQAANPNLPDLDHPLTGSTVTIPASSPFQLHIRGLTPADAAFGQYSYGMTVTNPAPGANPPSWQGSTLLYVSAAGELPDATTVTTTVRLAGTAAAVIHPNQELTYRLIVQNPGSRLLAGLTLTGVLPAHTEFVACAGGDACVRDGNNLTWNLARLGAGLSHTMLLTVRVPDTVPVGTELTLAPGYVTTLDGVSANGPSLTTRVQPYLTYLPNAFRLQVFSP